jgi:uncharacterized membrane protein (DUF2068 family)
VADAHDPRRSRVVLRLIAAERIVRSLLLLAAGIYLLSHRHTDFGRIADHVARSIELDPRRPFVRHLIEHLHRLHAGTLVLTGIAALGYGALELVEGVGLWLDQLWAEYLTVIATALLVPLEVYELVRKPSALKAGGIVVNLAIVAYLAWNLRRRLRAEATSRAPA